ncbi:FAD-binding domain-containing protein, partial [Brevirhabdus pacifica]
TALNILNAFLPDAAGEHADIAALAPYLRHRLLSEAELLEAALARHGAANLPGLMRLMSRRLHARAWIQARPSVWYGYRQGVATAADKMQRDEGLHQAWQDACDGQTGIEPFNAWARELVDTGTLAHRKRRWFASVWIFTLRLPWELGADFFMRHLLDGDPSLNTVLWREVAGLQDGHPYLVTVEEIAEGSPPGHGLCHSALTRAARAIGGEAPPLPAPINWERADRIGATGLVVHEDDLSPEKLLPHDLDIAEIRFLSSTEERAVMPPASAVLGFAQVGMADARRRLGPSEKPVRPLAPWGTVEATLEWVLDRGLRQVVTAHAQVGPAAEKLADLEARLRIHRIPLRRLPRRIDVETFAQGHASLLQFRRAFPEMLNRAGVRGTGIPRTEGWQ